MLKINEINEFNQFFELRNKWNKLLERSQDANPFLTWEYLSLSWKHFGKEKELKILSIEDKDEIIAIAPLRQSRYNFAKWLGYGVIAPLGYMRADYTGLILVKKETECLKLFFNYLFQHNDWDFIYLNDFPGTSIVPDLLKKVSKDVPLTFEVKEGVTCPYLPLPNSIELFKKDLSKNFRKNLRRRMRKLKRDYPKASFETYNQFDEIEEAANAFFELHQKRWNLKGMPGVFNTQKVRDFSIDVIKSFASNQWLALSFIIVNDEPIAARYNFEYKQKMYSYLGGFDPDYSQYGVGNLLFAKVIEDCIVRKIKEYDFLKGDERYKFFWTKKYRKNLNIKIVNKKVTSNLYDFGIKTVKQFKGDKILEKFLNFD